MEALSRGAARTALRLALSYAAIVVALLAGAFVWNAWHEHRASTAQIATLQGAREALADWRKTAATQAAQRVATLETASRDAIDRRIAEIDTSTKALSAPGLLPALAQVSSLSAAGAALVQGVEREAQMALLAREREILEQIRAFRTGPAALEAQRRAHLDAYAALTANEYALAQLRADHPVRVVLPMTAERASASRLEEAQRSLRARNQEAYDAYELQRKVSAALRMPERGFARMAEATDRALQRLDDDLAQREAAMARSATVGILHAVAGVAWQAALILLVVVMTPVAFKVLFYYVLAPVAARRPPVCLLPAASGSLAGLDPPEGTKVSAVSLPVALGPGDVLLVHPDFLQSSGLEARIDTQWLLDRHHPLTSLAAGMRMLTRIRAAGRENVVVSATREPLTEVGVLELPEGARFVLQPRCLVGAVHPADRPLRITGMWRLGTLHAWLTLQLRYLVFHGPVRLVVKGCRGIRVEPAGGGRRINQAATIGWSANLRYSTSRSETFAAYLFGQRELFNDSFAGEGWYVYEETPDRRGAGGITGRGLEGVADAVLKVFGV